MIKQITKYVNKFILRLNTALIYLMTVYLKSLPSAVSTMTLYIINIIYIFIYWYWYK